MTPITAGIEAGSTSPNLMPAQAVWGTIVVVVEAAGCVVVVVVESPGTVVCGVVVTVGSAGGPPIGTRAT